MCRGLIVNADDFNTDRSRSRGILEAASRGIVTSTTALANLPWDEQDVTALKDVFGESIGVHLNLTKGAPLSAAGRVLTDAEGRFFAKPDAWEAALQRRFTLDAVEEEFTAQIETLLGLGITPSHIDGNNHIHIFPGIAGVVARLACRYRIRRIRLPRETAWERRWRWAGKRRFLARLANRAERIFCQSGLTFPNHFAGIDHPTPGSIPELLHLLDELPPGVTELMCHPGYSDPDSGSFSTPEREAELRALTAPEVIEQVEDAGIRLISYAELDVLCRQET